MVFFSSRRRHTRCGRDWSSDVCSSDLIAGVTFSAAPTRSPSFSRFSSSATITSLPAQMSAIACRSEEHTSELQSRPHLVCRLLLEKKKKKKKCIHAKKHHGAMNG